MATFEDIVAQQMEKRFQARRARGVTTSGRPALTLAACHRSLARNRAVIAAAKAAGCSRCLETEPICLDFHHVDPSTKEFGIASSVRHVGPERLAAEIAKCILLCANCHRKEHR